MDVLIVVDSRYIPSTGPVCAVRIGGRSFFFPVVSRGRESYYYDDSPHEGVQVSADQSPTCVLLLPFSHHSGSCSRPWRKPQFLHRHFLDDPHHSFTRSAVRIIHFCPCFTGAILNRIVFVVLRNFCFFHPASGRGFWCVQK